MDLFLVNTLRGDFPSSLRRLKYFEVTITHRLNSQVYRSQPEYFEHIWNALEEGPLLTVE